MIGMNSRSPSTLLDEELPRDEVGVVLHLGQDDRVAAGDVAPAPRVGDEVDRLGRVAGEDDLVAVGGVDEAADLGPGPSRTPRSPSRRSCRCRDGRWRCTRGSSRRRASMTTCRLLAARRRVEVDERMAVDLLVEDREVAAQRVAGRGAARRRWSPSRVSMAIGGWIGGLAADLHGLELRPALRAPAAPRRVRRPTGRPRAGSGRSPRPRGEGPGPCRRSSRSGPGPGRGRRQA